MKRILTFWIGLVILATLPVSAQKLKKSVTWENLKNHPAPIPVLGELVPVHSEIGMESW